MSEWGKVGGWEGCVVGWVRWGMVELGVGMWVGADDAWTLSMCFDVCFDAQRRVPWVLRFRV